MGSSMIQIQRSVILETVRHTDTEWKLLIVDEGSRKLIDNVTKEDDILNENVTEILQIEEPRQLNEDMDAVYLLSPLPHIVECLLADFEKRKYRRSFLVWTSLLNPGLRRRIDDHPAARSLIAGFRTLNVEFFPRESHLITFRDPWSFPILFHPACNQLIRQHLEELTQKIVSICVSLGEYPTIRYYRPRNPNHEASVLSSHLARMIQDAIDEYAHYHEDFPQPSPRPRGVLLIVDRSMDLFSPLLHEFTYQAMAIDLLPIKDGDKVTYRTTVNQGRPNEETKDMELGEKDKIWVANRHMHMKDLLERLVGDFKKFRDENPQFAENTENTTSINTVKDMLAGLPQFQEGKEAYSLHLTMAQECMKLFQEHKLTDMASVEQSLSTGLDEDYRKPKNLADQVVRLLDDDGIPAPDRLRLILQYAIYRDGLLNGDIKKLLAHAQLPPQDGEVISNMELLGARVQKPLKDSKPSPPSLFVKKPPPLPTADVSGLSRFETAVRLMLEDLIRGALDQTTFPFTRPHLDASDGLMGQDNVSTASLRAKPTWAKSQRSSDQPKQRIIVFMAGGATYAESRACYEISNEASKDVYLATSHMLDPSLFLRQLSDLGVDRRRLDIPADRPKTKPPAHLFEQPQRSQPPASVQPPQQKQPLRDGRSLAPPTAQMDAMNVKSKDKGDRGGKAPNGAHQSTSPPQSGGKLQKKDKEKKKHHFF